MAYVTMPTWTTGFLVTAACLTQYSNNDEYLKGRAGSILFENGANFSGPLSACASVPNSAIDLRVQNTDGGGGNSHARLAISASSSGGGDPSLYWIIEGVTAYCMGLDNSDNDLLKIGPGTVVGASTVVALNASAMFINDSSNAGMTAGLTINQMAATNEIIALKSSAVAHGLTAITETDTWALVKQRSGGNGGLDLWGIYESSSNDAAVIHGAMQSDDTGKATDRSAYVRLEANKYSGSSLTTPGTNANLVGISSGTGALQFIFDAEGDLHANAAVTASAYDAYNDIGLVRALELHRTPATVVREVWDEWVQYSREDLQQLQIATFNDYPGGDGSIFINYTALVRLHSGALWQMHKRVAEVERVTAALANLLAAPSRVRGWVAGVGRRLLGRRDGRPPAGRR